MLQLVQNLKTGKMDLLDVPFPALNDGYILVRNHFSLISAGTESSKVKTARASLITKAKQKPEKVKQVIDSLKSDGIRSTYQKVMNKLDFPAPLGYSCAGEIIEVGENVKEFSVGDFVACGGASAVHAEVVAVPKNLCVKIPSNVETKHAAFTTVGAIALQGIRQADLHLGENCVVIGLGLIGQLTVQLLNSAGIKVAGIDIDKRMVELAKESGALLSLQRDDPALESLILDFSDGHGVDAAIITAGTSSTDPVELAGKLCRKKGKVIIVGAVPTGFSRPNYYKKELELRMSTSYGPGRYDSNYEEKGLDYPIGYVRWTENRNMKAFLDLLSAGELKLDLLISHEFDFTNALKAYDLIVSKKDFHTGILLKYDYTKKTNQLIKYIYNQRREPQKLNIGFIGAGSFAQKFLLPIVVKYANMIGVATASGNSAANIAKKYGFEYATGNYKDIIENKDINTVFIATRHNQHAKQVIEALKAGKNVFVEKPLAIRIEELEEIKVLYQNILNKKFPVPDKKFPLLMVGFNRRFAPLIQKMMEIVGFDTIKSINYRINVGYVPPDHWTQDPEIGGGRIIGEVCHFVDLCMYIAGSKPVALSAFALDSPLNLMDTLTINIKFANGSIAAISYFANGNKNLNKEYLEVYSNTITAVLNDFKKLEIYSKKKTITKSSLDKGHTQEVKLFLEAIKNGEKSPIEFEDIYISSLLPFKIIESINNKKVVYFDF